jgi:hypothetical protein
MVWKMRKSFELLSNKERLKTQNDKKSFGYAFVWKAQHNGKSLAASRGRSASGFLPRETERNRKTSTGIPLSGCVTMDSPDVLSH